MSRRRNHCREGGRAHYAHIAVPSVDATPSSCVDALGFQHVMGMIGKDEQLDFCTSCSALPASCPIARPARRLRRAVS